MHPINLKKIIPIALITLFSYVSAHSQDESDNDSLDGLTEELVTKTKLTQDLTLCRTDSGAVVAQYTDTLNLQNDCKLKLDSGTTREKTTRLFKLASADSYKSHVTASSVYVYDTKEDTYGRKERSFTTGLGFPGVTSKSDIVIDWASNQSLVSAPDLFKRKSTCSNGHSEPQFIEDFSALWTKDSTTIVKQFIPQSTKERNAAKSVVMCGCNLYGPFDMCDVCLSEIISFRKKHQQGQTSVSQAVRDELKDQFQGSETDAFVVSYHSYCPYKSATYHAEAKDSLYSLAYLQPTYRPRKDMFRPESKKVDDTYTLSQTESIPLKRDRIYSHVHLLAGKKVPYMNAQNTFTF